jgi:hypothetical protein
MYIWTVTVNHKNKELVPFNPHEVSEPYISAEYAMRDWFWNHLDWRLIRNPKFGGAVLEHWYAEDDKYEFILESQHVNGTE